MNADTLLHFFETVFQFSALCTVTVGLVYSYLQIIQAKKLHADILQWNKRIATENRLEDRPKNRTKLNNAFNIRGSYKILPLDDILNKAKEEDFKSILNNINHVINTYDRIARGIRHDIYIEDLVRDTVKHTFLKTYMNYYEYIKMKQDDKPFLWVDYTNLVEKWFPNSRRSDHKISNNAVFHFFERSETYITKKFNIENDNWYLFNYKESIIIKEKILDLKIKTVRKDVFVVGSNLFGSFLLVFDEIDNNNIYILDLKSEDLKRTDMEINNVII